MDCPKTVLVVDDEPDTREALCELLEDAGYAAVGVPEGQAALEHLALGTGAPCLIVLDLMTPFGLDGHAFRAAQLERPEWATIPVVVLSAVADLHDHASLLRPAAYLAKPAEVDTLLGLVAKHCAPGA